ncbi:inner centromere protein-like [Oxyura jamaicensis]|uniref:inner centromere protein-like n=1 Tax=Oxyura jamaicensis TaxID=8884 RepID=UPI0015A6E4DE|nr:inner centromere protein-like [Oxyura jamaicensis]XP_035167590.1 inner centromere protein-like [Oxyura jamaicensis]
MAEAEGPWRLLEVCEQRFSQFLHNAQHKHLAWLREVEEQGRRLLESNFWAEPGLMPKKPSQRRRPKKRQSSLLRDESEPTRRRLSRRRSSVKLVSSKPGSQRHHSKEQPQNLSEQGEEVSVPDCAAKPQLSVKTELPAPPGKEPAEAQGPVAEAGCDDGPQAELSPEGDGADGGGAALKTREQVPEGDAATERHDVPAVSVIPGEQTAREGEEVPQRRSSTPMMEAARKRDSAILQVDLSPQDLEKVLLPDPNSKRTTTKSKAHRCSGRQSCVGGPHKNRRTSLSDKYSLASRRENMIQKSISRAISKKAAAARESSSASSRVSCQSSLEVFVEDVTSNMRSGPELNSQSEKVPENLLTSSRTVEAASPSAQCSSPPEQQAGSNEGSCVNPNSEPQNMNQEQAHGAKSQESPSCIWTRSCKQRMGVVRNGQQPGGRAPLEDKHVNSTNQAPHSASPASKVVRPLKNFLQAVQRSQLLASPGPTGRGSVIKNLIKHNTPTRPDPKGDFVKKERQRLESLRKKQEAEEQRRKKVEEEKRRRQAEMKQKREERLRKALQARERVEQLEEEKKKKRMQQKTSQNDEKVRLSQVREERLSEEWSKKKLSKKPGETDARKQKTLKVEEDESEQHELLQKRREDKAKEKGKKALELKNLAEQRQVEQVKERDLKQQEGEKSPQHQLDTVVFTEKCIKEEDDLEEPWQQLAEEKKIKQPESSSAASNMCLSKTIKKSISTSCLKPPKSTKIFRSPKVNENNYGMDLNSDDSTDDESAPRKPVPAWADGSQLNQAILHQYYHPVDVDELFGLIASPKLEDIFGKSKPRYFKRTSSAVWHSPPGTKSACGPTCNFKN